uniref:Uncharacterized protein n=1 Tax=viral metagenome TaxID=1070528 RepID=A0A6C0ATX1_9ZZZZ
MMQFYIVYDAATPEVRVEQLPHGQHSVAGYYVHTLHAPPPPCAHTFTMLCMDDDSVARGQDITWVTQSDAARAERAAHDARDTMNDRMGAQYDAFARAMHTGYGMRHCSIAECATAGPTVPSEAPCVPTVCTVDDPAADAVSPTMYMLPIPRTTAVWCNVPPS